MKKTNKTNANSKSTNCSNSTKNSGSANTKNCGGRCSGSKD